LVSCNRSVPKGRPDNGGALLVGWRGPPAPVGRLPRDGRWQAGRATGDGRSGRWGNRGSRGSVDAICAGNFRRRGGPPAGFDVEEVAKGRQAFLPRACWALLLRKTKAAGLRAVVRGARRGHRVVRIRPPSDAPGKLGSRGAPHAAGTSLGGRCPRSAKSRGRRARPGGNPGFRGRSCRKLCLSSQRRHATSTRGVPGRAWLGAARARASPPGFCCRAKGRLGRASGASAAGARGRSVRERAFSLAGKGLLGCGCFAAGSEGNFATTIAAGSRLRPGAGIRRDPAGTGVNIDQKAVGVETSQTRDPRITS